MSSDYRTAERDRRPGLPDGPLEDGDAPATEDRAAVTCPACLTQATAARDDLAGTMAAALDAVNQQMAQAAHEAADPHCTCPDCLEAHAARLEG